MSLQNFQLVSHFCRRRFKNGGSAIFVKMNVFLNCEVFEGEFSLEGVIECCGIIIREISTIIFSIYRPPSGDYDLFLDHFNNLMDFVSNSFAGFRIVIGGDFNIHFNTRGARTDSFVNLVECCGLKCIIDKPTRVFGTSATTIDNILINDKVVMIDVGVIDLSVADHFGQFLRFSVEAQNSVPLPVEKRYFSRPNIEQFRSHLSCIDWNFLYNEERIDDAYGKFITTVLYYFELCFPLRQSTKKRSLSSTGLNPVLVQARDKMLLARELASRFPELKEQRREAEHHYVRLLEAARRQHYNNRIATAPNKSKVMWNIIDKELGKNNNNGSHFLAPFSNKALTEADVVIGFSEKFSRSSVSLNDLDLDFMCKNVKYNSSSLFFHPVCCSDTFRLVGGLNSSGSRGYDEFSNYLLKCVKHELGEPLTFLANLMLETGSYPSQLKLAMVLPLYKKGDRSSFENYRPISLLSTFAKFFELVIYEQFTGFLFKHNVLSERQHGFVRGRCIETALFEFVRGAVGAIDSKCVALGLFVDFSGAFDSVDHQLLLYKLERYGVRGSALDLIKSYITERRQLISLPTGGKGDLSDVNMGVPQGSILGPILYITFANDLFSFLGACELHDVVTLCYADDTNFLIKSKDVNEAVSRARAIYGSVALWSKRNFLTLNATKTVSVLFTGVGPAIELTEHISQDIGVHSSTKLLGVTLDSHLNWFLHIDSLVAGLRANCYGLRSLRNICDRSVLLCLYHGSFHSRMRFGIILWGASGSVQRVFVVQKYALRLIAGLRRDESCRGAFRACGILTVYSAYIYELCCFVHKNYRYFYSNEIDHIYDTRHKNYLKPDRHTTAFYQRNVFFNGCKFYNALPKDMKSSTMYLFKKSLKAMLLNKTCYALDDFFN